MDKSVYDLGRAQYRDAVGISDMDRDADGFLVLRPTANHVDKRVESLTTDIDTLEAKLKQFREEKAKAVKYQKSEEYKESKKKDKEKKNKKARNTLLEMVFNNADAVKNSEEDDEDDGYRENKKRAPKKTTLDTTYGKRFSPVVSMLYDTIADFDRIAREIDEELNSTRGQTRGMYRSSQIGNYITAKNSRLSAVKELGAIAKTVSDLEYKRDRDKRADEGSDSTKAITSLGAKYLRGNFDLGFTSDSGGSGKKGKSKNKEKKNKSSGSPSRVAKEFYDPDDDDDDEDVRRPKNAASDRDLAKELANAVLKNKKDMSFTPHERYLSMEGKYTFVVAVDPIDPEHTWKFIAVNPENGKEIKGFKEDYKDLYPKKKNVRPKFDVGKKKMTDLNTSKTYKLVFSS